MGPVLTTCISNIDLISKNANRSPEAFSFTRQNVGNQEISIITANSKFTELGLKIKHYFFGGGEIYRKRLNFAIEEKVEIVNRNIAQIPFTEIQHIAESATIEITKNDEKSAETDFEPLTHESSDSDDFLEEPVMQEGAFKVAQLASYTDCFLTAQRYNHSIGMAVNENSASAVPLFDDQDLTLINYPAAMPVEINGAITTTALENIPDAQKPHMVESCWHSHKMYHYNEADLEQSPTWDAAQIFFCTQFERLLSVIGRIVETMIDTSVFSSYHYFSNNEDKKGEIYAKDSPLSQTQKGSSFFEGHATVSMNIPVKSTTGGDDINVNIITDPVEGDLNAILYPRMTDPARLIDDCPVPHVFLLSHNHLDHFDKNTLQKLVKYQPVMIVPEGDREKFTKLGFKNVHETNWWQKTTIPINQGKNQGKLEITTVPANHWSGQGPCDGHQSTFVGYVIHKEGGDVYFAGDTARLSSDHIKTLRERFDIRTMFQPGGPDECRENMKGTHQSSVDAIWMHFELLLQNLYEKGGFKNRSKAEFIEEFKKLRTIYMHNKTFKLGNLHFDDTDVSVARLIKAIETEKLEGLREHELEVLNQIKEYWVSDEKKLRFKDETSLTKDEILEILNATVIIPKIGSRTEFAS